MSDSLHEEPPHVQLATLTQRWPHPGILDDAGINKSRPTANYDAFKTGRDFDTSSLDVLLVLLRVLLAFGLAPNVSSEAQAEFCHVAWSSNLGRIQFADAKAKTKLLKLLYGELPSFSLTAVKECGFTAHHLLSRLDNFFLDNDYFTLQERRIRQHNGNLEEILDNESCRELLIPEGQDDFQAALDQMFASTGVPKVLIIGEQPRFIRVRRRAGSDILDLSTKMTVHLCSITLQYPARKLETQDQLYKLLAVVRLAEPQKGIKDAIYLFNRDGIHIKPINLDTTEIDDWEGDNGGELLIFYHRVETDCL